MIYEGLLTIYRLKDVAEKGRMPRQQLVFLSEEYYEERTVGYNRNYAALGADRRVDALVRIWRLDTVQPNDYAVLEDGNQYRIDFVQHLKDDDGLPVSDLTLIRLEDFYDVAGNPD